MTDRDSLVALSGSLRKGSFCTAVAHTAADLVSDRAVVEVVTLDDIPLYNQDLEGPSLPASVGALREKIDQAAGLVIITPEYNYGMSGVLKNALDWLSRPYGQSKLTGKKVLTVSVSPAFTGGVRAQSQLHDTLLANAVRLLPLPQIVIGMVHEKVHDDRLVDEAAVNFLRTGLDKLLSY